jgi:hypothetical protein
MENQTKWDETVSLWKSYRILYGISGFIIGLLAFPAINAVINNFDEFLQGLVPEALGIGFAVLFIDKMYAIRSEEQRIQNLKERLIREAGSPSNVTSLHAIKELRNHNWLEGKNGLLKGQDLVDADLQKAKLAKACLHQTDLSFVNLTEANLYMCNSRFANFWRANLQKANLKWADLSQATLIGADLRGVDLQWCNLEGVTLWGYSVNNQEFVKFDSEWDHSWQQFVPHGAKLFSAIFDKDTILPDGTSWTEQTDMRRYTFSQHPEFWKPEVDEQGKPIWYRLHNIYQN